MTELPDPKPTKGEKDAEKEESPIVSEDVESEDAQLRINKQCYLMRNIEAFMRVGARANRAGYKHFSCVTGPPMDITNELVSIKGLAAMFNLTTAQHAVLSPRIRLFIKKNGKMIEMPFDASLSAGGASSANISDMVRSSNFRGSGAGIKSFSYELAGIDPATADRLINAKLTLYFKSIADLFAVRDFGQGGFQYADLINMKKAALPSKVKSRTNKVINDDSDKYEIRAVVGWGDVPVGHPLFPNPATIDGVKQSKVTFALQLINHNIKFNQDGTLELEIEYMASIDYALSTSSLDVFWMPESEQLERIKTGIQNEKRVATERAKLQLEKEREVLEKTRRQGLSDKAASAELEEINKRYTQHANDSAEAIEKEIEALEQLRRSRRTLAYRRIVDSLIGDEDGTGGKLYVKEVDPAEIGVIGRASAGRVLSTRSAAEAGKKQDPKKIHSEAKPASQKEAQDLSKRMANTIADGAGKDGLDAKKEKAKKKSNISASKATGDRSKNNGKVKIYYFYLGDLIDILLEILKGNVVVDGKQSSNEEAKNTLKQVRILVGPAVLVGTEGGKLKSKIGNLADVPISFDLFENWFTYHVIRPQRTSYYFKKFIQDIMRELVGPALGGGCYAGEKQKAKVSTIPLRVPVLSGGGPRIPNLSRCYLKHLRGRKSLKLRSEVGSTNIRESHDYLYFFMPDTRIKEREVNEAIDIRQGIYHLRIGSDKGLVQSIDFEKTDIKFLRESRITNDAETKDGFLREKYDARIKMVGNSFFTPGQYVYILPSVPGYEQGHQANNYITREKLQTLGFGGYYLITKVDHIISSDYYQTNLIARWESYGTARRPYGQPVLMYEIGECIMKEAEAAETYNTADALDAFQEQERRDAAAKTIVGGVVKTAFDLDYQIGNVARGAAISVFEYVGLESAADTVRDSQQIADNLRAEGAGEEFAADVLDVYDDGEGGD